MKLNNKGITLVEIIISVALISIVLVFLFNLLIQVNNENSDNEVRSSYLVNQATFIKQIEEDFIEQILSLGETCTSSDFAESETENKLYLPKIYNDSVSLSGTNINIKCLKFTYEDNHKSYLFLYKRKDGTSYKTILSYYNGDFKQSVELEDFNWNDNLTPICNKCNVVTTSELSTYKVYSLPIIGPDYKDYSINLSYAS